MYLGKFIYLGKSPDFHPKHDIILKLGEEGHKNGFRSRGAKRLPVLFGKRKWKLLFCFLNALSEQFFLLFRGVWFLKKKQKKHSVVENSKMKKKVYQFDLLEGLWMNDLQKNEVGHHFWSQYVSHL